MDAGVILIDYRDEERTDCCPHLVQVLAAFREKSRQIPAWCKHEKFVKFLNIAEYGFEFDIAGSKNPAGGYPPWYRITERRRFEILERDGFACVWCREQIKGEEIAQVSAADESRLDDATGSSSLRMFFDHDADHLFTLQDYSLLNAHVPKEYKEQVGQEWVVTACERCNRGRRERLTPARSLLSVYARHLLERTGQPDWEDLDRFIRTIKMLRVRRSRRPATGTEG